jgi:lysophospholipase L1-like esterase
VSSIKKYFKLFCYGNGYISRHGKSIKGDITKKVLILGDSTAVGACSNQMETIGGRLSRKFNIDVTNLGLNGARTEEIILQSESVSNQKFYLTIIHAGNMDIAKFTNLKKLECDFIKLIDKTKSISEKIIIFRGGNFALIPGFPFFLRWIWGKRSRAVRNLFKRISEEKSVYYIERFIDTNQDTEDVFLKRPYHYYSWDLMHLNENGYKVWFDYLLEEMSKTDINLASRL